MKKKRLSRKVQLFGEKMIFLPTKYNLKSILLGHKWGPGTTFLTKQTRTSEVLDASQGIEKSTIFGTFLAGEGKSEKTRFFDQNGHGTATKPPEHRRI